MEHYGTPNLEYSTLISPFWVLSGVPRIFFSSLFSLSTSAQRFGTSESRRIGRWKGKGKKGRKMDKEAKRSRRKTCGTPILGYSGLVSLFRGVRLGVFLFLFLSLLSLSTYNQRLGGFEACRVGRWEGKGRKSAK